MAFDFPNSPTNGQVFTPAGGPSYTYDSAGNKWTVTATAFTGQPLDALLTSIAALSMTANDFIYGTGIDTVALSPVTSFARTLLDDSSSLDARETLDIVTSAYTPTLTNTTNISASTAFQVPYLAIANRVIISGYLEADAVTTGLLTELQMSIPIASDFTLQIHAGGAAAQLGAPIVVSADNGTDRIRFVWNASSVSNISITFMLMYRVV